MYVKELQRCLQEHDAPDMSLSDLVRVVKKPPALRCSTMVFLRQYPDVFLAEVHEVTGHVKVRLNGFDERGEPTDLSGPAFVT